jgi:hypothetical protein
MIDIFIFFISINVKRIILNYHLQYVFNKYKIAKIIILLIIYVSYVSKNLNYQKTK